MSKAVKAKIKPDSIILNTNSYGRNTLYNTAFWGLCLFLFLPPFFRGLFFNTEQYKALFFATIIFLLVWIWIFQKGQPVFFHNPLDYIIICLPLVYLAASFKAVNTGTAVDEVLKNALYFMVYWMVARLVINLNDAMKLLRVVYASAVGVALAGLFTATGLINIKDGFLNGRIYSSFQYPNALASFLIAALFIGLYLWLKDSNLNADKTYQKKSIPGEQIFQSSIPYIYTLFTYIICVALVGTRSNGGFLVLLVFLGVYFAGIKGSDKLRVFVHLTFTLLPAAGAALLFIQNAVAAKHSNAWLWVLAGAFITAGLQYINARLSKSGFWDKLWSKKWIISIALIALIVAAGAFAVNYANSNQELINKTLAEFRLRNATERMYFYSDALKMVKERPLLGWGGGGWQEAYRAYQGYLYNSNQVHSYYLQVLVETGVAGLAVVLGIWAIFLYIAHRLYRRLAVEATEKLLIWTVFIAALGIGAHALIDFDLSLSALAIVLCTLWGISSGLYNAFNEKHNPAVRDSITFKRKNGADHNKYIKKYMSTVLVSIACMAILFTTANFSYAIGDTAQAKEMLKRGDVKSGTSLLESAARKNPFSAEYNATLANLYEQLGKNDLAVEQARQVLDKASYNSVNYAVLARLCVKTGEYDKAESYADKALNNAPFQISWYEFLAQTYFTSGYSLMAKGKKQEAVKYLEKTADVENLINKRVAGLGQVEKQLWNVAPMLAPTPILNLYSGASLCLTGDYPLAEQKLNIALSSEQIRGEVLTWLSIVKEKQGKIAESNELLGEALELSPKAREQVEQTKKVMGI